MNTLGPSLKQDVSVLARVQGSLAKPRRQSRPGPTLRAEKNSLRGRRATGASGGGSGLQETDRFTIQTTEQAPTFTDPDNGPKNGVHLRDLWPPPRPGPGIAV
jgi:hypothetical protein